MERRTFLTMVGCVTLSLGGCTAAPDTGSIDGEPATGGSDGESVTGTGTMDTDNGATERTDGPEDCPTSHGLGVDWPEQFDAATVESFVEEYERVYYRDVVVEYEPESQLDSYELSGSVNPPVEEVGEGWELEYSGGGGVYRPTLLLGATPSTPPEGADVVPVSGIDDAALAEMLDEAATKGAAEHHVDTPGAEVDRYVDLFASLSDDFERLAEPGDTGTLYVDVDGTTVELTVSATNFHGDYSWTAWYYVDERIVQRTTDADADPRHGEPLECRKPT